MLEKTKHSIITSVDTKDGNKYGKTREVFATISNLEGLQLRRRFQTFGMLKNITDGNWLMVTDSKEIKQRWKGYSGIPRNRHS